MMDMLKRIALSAKSLPWAMGSNPGAVTLRVVLLLFSSLSLLLPMVAAQPGFINIDCGSTSNYTDSKGLVWTTDDGYISTGSNRNVTGSKPESENVEQMSTARYFQQQSRQKHCYVLPVTDNTSYLIRAFFLYGNLEASLPSDYSFNLSIDATTVETVSITPTEITETFDFEYVVASTSQQVAFCIIPIIGNPFISSLELKTLGPDVYKGVVFGSKYIKTLHRINCGVDSTFPSVRFPDDLEYDRLWKPRGGTVSVPPINTTANVTVRADGNPPVKVMQTAWQASGSAFSFNQRFAEETTTIFYIALYFAEIGTPNSTDVRSIDVDLNGDRWYRQYNVTANGRGLYSSGGTTSITARNANITLSSNPVSTLPPILNAFEFHAVYDTITTTESTDVSAVYAMRQNLNLLDWTGDPCLPIPWDWLKCSSREPGPPLISQLNLSGYELTGTISPSIANLSALTDVWLDNNNLTGSIPNLAPLAHLRTLHLQNNSLTGTIPASLADISSLSELFLQGNNLSGPVPTGLLSKNGLNLTVDSFTNSSASPPNSSHNNSVNTGVIIGIVIGAVAGVLVLLIAVLIFFRRRRKKKTKTEPHPEITGSMSHLAGTHKPEVSALADLSKKSSLAGGVFSHHLQMMPSFSLAEVLDLTDNFRRKIGEGGFGPVYYGKLATGEEVAVKVNSATSGQGSHEFSTEVSLLSRVHHRNLVSLVGFCCEDDKRILLYEYMENGTLREHLYSRDLTKVVPMDWRARLGIALDAARGLEYLHYDCRPKIIHRDVKSSNILLDEKFRAKVADFGISKLASEEDTTSGVSTVVRGTTGYVDPEYFSTQKITPKSDVYAFGVVLLELICGRAPNNNKLADTLQWNLIQYVRGSLRYGNLEQIIDPSLTETSNYNIEAVWKLAELAMCCVQPQGKDRPEMRQVVRELVEAVNLEHMHDSKSTFPNPISPGLGVTALLEDNDNDMFTQSSYGSYNSWTQSSQQGSTGTHNLDPGYQLRTPHSLSQAPPSGSANWDTPSAR